MSRLLTNRRVAVALGVAVLTWAAANAATLLRYNLKAGDEWKYRNTVVAQGTLTIAGPLGAQPLPVSINADETRTMKVVEAVDGGWFTVESKQIKGSYAATVAGESLSQGADTMPPLNYRMKLNARGDVSEMENIKPAEPNAQASIDLNLGQLTTLGELAGFPEQAVEVGATWDKVIPIKTKDDKTLEAKVQNKLVSLEGTEAKITSSYDMPIPPTEGVLKLGMDIPIKIEGRAQGHSIATWDTAKSCITHSEGNANMEIKLYLVGLTAEPALGKFITVIKGDLVP